MPSSIANVDKSHVSKTSPRLDDVDKFITLSRGHVIYVTRINELLWAPCILGEK